MDRIVSGRSGLEVLDVGCGTGIAARQFQAAGCAVLGIDPDQRMAEYARGRGLDVELATFEGWEPARAIPVFRETAKRFPEQWVAHMAMARVLSSEKKFAEALNEAKASKTGAPPQQIAQIDGLIARLEKGEDINQ